MSNEYDDDEWYTLECVCGQGCPCRQNDYGTHLNAVRRNVKDDEKSSGLDINLNSLPGGELSTEQSSSVKWINVRGRHEHEAVIKDAALCRELGLDQAYEVMVYLKRWGNWLGY